MSRIQANGGMLSSRALKLPAEPRFLLHGCYGEKNAGDEALLASTLHVLSERWPNAHFCVSSQTPGTTSATYGVESVSSQWIFHARSLLSLWRRRHLGNVIRALRDCHCLVLGGGELLRTDFGWRALSSMLDRIVLARLMGKQVVMLGIGIGKLDAGLKTELIRWACAQATVLTREEDSAAILTSLGVPHVQSISDLAFQLPEEEHGLALPDAPRVALCLLSPARTRSCSGLEISREEFLAAAASLADEIVAVGARPIFVPFNSWNHSDQLVHRDVLARMSHASSAVLVEEELPPSRLKALLGDVDAVVGMRFHACVFALSQGRPLLALAYDPKISKMMKHFHLEEYALPLQQMERARFLFRELWRDRADWRARIAPVLEHDAFIFRERADARLGPRQTRDVAGVADLRGRASRRITDMRVSVIIPTYNAQKFVGRAIRSVLAQTRLPQEIIVVDDGSTDGTGEAIRREFGSQVRYHYQDNRGPSAARNAGIRLSTGDWVAFLDADDTWQPEKLELQEAEVLADSEVAMVVCETQLYDSEGKKCGRYVLPRALTRQAVFSALKLRNVFPMAVMVRRDVFDVLGGFDENLFCGEDREMWARIAARFKIAPVHRPLLNVTCRLNSVSADPKSILRDGFIINRRLMTLLQNPTRLGRMRDRLILQKADARLLLSAAYAYNELDETSPAARSLLGSLRRWPFARIGVYGLALRLCLRMVVNSCLGAVDGGADTRASSKSKADTGSVRPHFTESGPRPETEVSRK